MATTEDLRADLRRLVDQLPESELHTARRFLLRCVHDPLLRKLLEAPEDDEELTEEDVVALAEAYEDIKAGRVYTLEEVKRELGL
ncbi:MAG: hypothetical protein HY691_03440 [Chloroflexi bacterium]|nr:hypothetical protein [Chloroflexota bacterium]